MTPDRTLLFAATLAILTPALGCSGGGDPAGNEEPDLATLSVTVVTSGLDLDGNGYRVELDGGAMTRTVPLNGSVEFESVQPGLHSVRLADVAANCRVPGENPREITSTTTFEVQCLRFFVVREGDASNNVAPFGGAVDQRYQQIYAAGAMSGGGRIRMIQFFSPNQPDAPLATADYHFRLETTSISVMGLSHEMDDNLGAGAVTVLQQNIAGMEYGDSLSFYLDTPFYYDAGAGNLLLDVVIANAVDEGQSIRTYEAMRNSSAVSRRPAYGGTGDGFGLVTRFAIDSVGSSP